MKTKLFIWILLVLTIFASCKRPTLFNNPPDPIKSIVLPYVGLILYPNEFITLPDQSFVIFGRYDNSKKLYLLKYDQDLNLLDSAIFESDSYFNPGAFVRGEKFYFTMGEALYEINSSLELVKINVNIEKNIGFDNSYYVNSETCLGPDQTILFAANGKIGGITKFVLAAYGQDITNPLWVVDTLQMGGGPDCVTAIGYCNKKLFVWGFNVINVSVSKSYRKIYQWGGSTLYEELLESQYAGGFYFKLLDSNLYALPGMSLVLEDNTTKYLGIYANQIFINQLNGYTVFSSSQNNLNRGYVCNLSKDYKVLKKYPIPYENGVNQSFGPAGPDTWIFASSFHDENNIMKIRLTKLNKDLE